MDDLAMCFNPVMLKIWSVLQFSFVETYTVLYISFNFDEGIWQQIKITPSSWLDQCIKSVKKKLQVDHFQVLNLFKWR